MYKYLILNTMKKNTNNVYFVNWPVDFAKIDADIILKNQK